MKCFINFITGSKPSQYKKLGHAGIFRSSIPFSVEDFYKNHLEEGKVGSFFMRKIIIDCDPGIDDALAIMLAANSPELDILAITTVSGNVPSDMGAANARKVLKQLGEWIFQSILEKKFRSGKNTLMRGIPMGWMDLEKAFFRKWKVNMRRRMRLIF